MAMGQPRVGQFPAGSWPTQGTIGSLIRLKRIHNF
jgi:hypothetical protein